MARKEHADWCELITGLWDRCDCGYEDDRIAEEHAKRMAAQKILREAEEIAKTKNAQGYTKQDFANELQEMFKDPLTPNND